MLLRAKFESGGARKTSRASRWRRGGRTPCRCWWACSSAAPIRSRRFRSSRRRSTHLEFKRFKTVADLEREVAAASASGKAVMVDFYADWCVSCIEMEHKTFTVPEVQAALKDTVLLQADVTKNDDEDKALYAPLRIVGPPTIAFYGADGKERRNFRVVGFMEACGVRGRGPAGRRSGGTRVTVKQTGSVSRALLGGRSSFWSRRAAATWRIATERAELGWRLRHVAEEGASRRRGGLRPRRPSEPESRRPRPFPTRFPTSRWPIKRWQAHQAGELRRPAADGELLGDLVRALPPGDPTAQ